MASIDTAWFHRLLEERSESVRGLARYMGLDASAVSRMLKGERKMSANEQDQISNFLGVNLEEIAARRRVILPVLANASRRDTRWTVNQPLRSFL